MLMPPDLPAGDAPALFALCPVTKRRRENEARDDGREVRRENARRGSVGWKSSGGDERVFWTTRARAREHSAWRLGARRRRGDRSRGAGARPREGAPTTAAGARARRKKGGRNLAAACRTRTKTPRTPSPSPRKISTIRTTTRAGAVARRVRRADAGGKGGKNGKNAAATDDTRDTRDQHAEAGTPAEEDIAASAASLARTRRTSSRRRWRARPDRRRSKRSRTPSRPRRASPTRDEKTRASPPPPRSRRRTHCEAFARGAEALAGDVSAARHCADARATPLADFFFGVRRRRTDAFADVPSVPSDGDGDGSRTTVTFPLTAKQREVAGSSFPSHARVSAETLAREATARRDPGAILRALEETAEALGVRLKGGDRKTERSLLHAHRKGLEARLRAEEDPAAALLVARAASSSRTARIAPWRSRDGLSARRSNASPRRGW